MSMSIAGKTAVVTGAANGVGLAIARHFVDKGANVMFADMDEARLQAEIGEAAREEGNIRFFAGDLCQKLTVANLLSATIDAFERIDILVNASRQFAQSDPLGSGEDILDMMLRQNVLGSLRLTQAVARRMIAQNEQEADREKSGGAIVNITTIAGQRVLPETLAYSISCAAMDQATRAMAVALAPHRIRVNGVAFGSLMSASLQVALKDHPEIRDEIAEATPLGRIASASELADAVQYLASQGAGFVTGQILTVDGGRSIKDSVGIAAF